MAKSSTKILQTILLLCSLCYLVKSDSRESYSNGLETRMVACMTDTKATTSFQNNVNLLFTDFNHQSSHTSYYNTTFGKTPDQVFGYFMCRGDVSHRICNSCILNGTSTFMGGDCKNVEGIYLSEFCNFRYSNHSMYGLLEMDLVSMYNVFDVNASNSQQFSRTLSSTLDNVINDAAFGSKNKNNSSRLGFATLDAVVEGKQTIYSLAQCTPDIVGVNCSNCLHSALSNVRSLANFAPAAISIMPKCQLRYDNISLHYDGNSNVSEGVSQGVSQGVSKGISKREQLSYLLVIFPSLFLFMFFNNL